MVKKVLKEFPVEYVQVLDENGNCDEELMPQLSNEQIKNFYEKMVLVRWFDQKAFNMQRQGRIGTYIQGKGQEATQVGASLALRDDDWLFPIYRDSGMLLVRKQPIHMILQYWNGDERGMKAPDNVNNFPISIPVGTQTPHASGAGWAAKLQGKDQVAMVTMGDGATSKGDFHEGLNFAGVFKTPSIFLCQNNQFAISVHREDQTHAETIAQKAIAYGIKGVLVDGNDILAVYRTVSEAAERGRRGEGPTLIECYTYRLADHSTSDDASRYRDEAELQKWLKRDPIERLEKFMKVRGLLDDTYKEKVLNDAKAFVESEVEKFEALTPPNKEDMFTFTFNELTPRQEEQLEDMHNN